MSITTIDYEAKNHCNFSVADTTKPFSYMSPKNEQMTEADTI